MSDEELQRLLDHMDDRKRDELLIRIDERLKRIEKRDASYDDRCLDIRTKAAKDLTAKLQAINVRIDEALTKSEEALGSTVTVVSWKTRATAFAAGVVACAGWALAVWKLVRG